MNLKVMHGGGFFNVCQYSTVSNRTFYGLSYKNINLSFRIIKILKS
jgi:hypothetical protein